MMKTTTLIAGLVALGIGQITAEITPEQPEVGWTTVISTITLVGQGGSRAYECAPRRLPWNQGACREIITGQTGCGSWTGEISTRHSNVRCDGNQHVFSTNTYWLRDEHGHFYNVGSVTPKITLPQFCQGPYLFNYTLTASTPDCSTCAIGSTLCDPPDPTCPPYCYNVPPLCCPDGWDCFTAWDPIGQLYYGVCCHQTQWGWVCQ